MPATRVDAQTIAYAFGGGVSIVAGGLVAAVNSAAPFAQGSWLAAYLVLVVGVSPLALELGCLLLPVAAPGVAARRARVLLWS